MIRRLFVMAAACCFLWSGSATARPRRLYRPLRFIATAFSIRGRTASGTRARPGTAAADPRILPLGSRIRVLGAGRYSGEYTVSDKGSSVRGRKIDLFVPNVAEARRFGRKPVIVQVIATGETEK